MKELRGLWWFGIILAIALFLSLQMLLGWSWDGLTIGLLLIGIVWIAFQWWRRYPHR